MNTVLHENARLKRQLAALMPAAVKKRAKEAVERLEHLQTVSDPEVAHLAADNALCTFLRDIGHREVADEFEAVERYYG